ncbi:hypothetical protein CC78DRAFT_571942 [Lojkania enalia]|uniref:Uncharacterized protein n=1 Tax=Lojkania enalia TaxID=147567 RepID=A0A9P4N226_9PLEO|nr:hypothetical protein CC78DRAFT_571942 [Didymosphaeria enalia]
MAGTVLLPAPFALNSVRLGQLLSDPLDPSAASYIAASTIIGRKEPHVQPSYKELIAHDDEGRFVSTLSGRPLSPSQENLLMVNADHMEYISLKNPSTAFDTLSHDPVAQTWLCEMAQRRQPLYYVVGLQKLKNPTFKRAIVKEGSIAEADANPKIRFSMHVRRDSAMDLEEEENGSDAVLGIEVRKVKCWLGRTEEPHSLDDIDYSWSYRMLDGEVQMCTGLGKALGQEEMRVLAGIAAEEDTDTSYESYYDISEDEDEGLAGF